MNNSQEKKLKKLEKEKNDIAEQIPKVKSFSRKVEKMPFIKRIGYITLITIGVFLLYFAGITISIYFVGFEQVSNGDLQLLFKLILIASCIIAILTVISIPIIENLAYKLQVKSYNEIINKINAIKHK